jgi:hypothetical protein
VPDVPVSGVVAIDEAGISGVVDGKHLVLSVGLANVAAEAASGELWVGIGRGDALSVSSSAVGAYSLEIGASGVFDVVVPMPSEISEQSDLATWLVRVVSDGKAPASVRRSLLTVLPAYEVALEGPKSLRTGGEGSFRVRATDPVNHMPLAGVPVSLALTGGESGAVPVGSYSGETGVTGDAVFSVAATDEPGDVSVVASGESQGTTAEVSDTVSIVANDRRLLLTTDKPIYQPGQVIHLRAVCLEKPGLAPVVGLPVTFEVEDGKGNKILKEEVMVDDFGVAATDFALGTILNEGTFAVRALLGDDKTEKSVDVFWYALPKFRVELAVDQPWYMPGQTITGTVDVGYFFGKPVAGGTVEIVASTVDVGETPFATVNGKTDAQGHFAFEVTLPSVLVGLPLEQGKALVEVSAVVTDTAEQVVEKSVAVVATADPVQVVVVPEAGDLVPGTANTVHVFATDPLGAPVIGGAVEVAALGSTIELETDAFGYAAFSLDVPADATGAVEIAVTVEADGAVASETFSFDAQGGAEHVLVRTDKAVYSVGESVAIDIVATGPSAWVYVDWLVEGQLASMFTLESEDGLASFEMDLDATQLGDNRIEAYIVDSSGQIVRASRTVFVKDAKALAIDVTTDHAVYAPGQPAVFTFSAKDEGGAPAVAALGVQIVDEAVYALVEARPGLLETYFALNDMLAQPQYEIHGASWDVSGLVFGGVDAADPDEAAAGQTQAEAAFAAMAVGGATGIQRSSWADLPGKSKDKLAPYFATAREAITPALTAAAGKALAELEAVGCPPSYWCGAESKEYLTSFAEHMRPHVKAWDYWGNAYEIEPASGGEDTVRIRSAGPDEATLTGDDWTSTFDYEELDLPESFKWLSGPWVDEDGGFAGGGGGDAEGGGPPEPNAGGDGKGDGEGSGPTVRKDFPETLYWNAALITGGDGKATVELDMADSITEWRISTLGHTKDGHLGSAVHGVTVFQDFFVDIDFPAKLTRKDELSFPIAIYNYLPVPQTVDITLEPGDWYTALGETSLSVDLGPNEVKVAKFPVRVDDVGTHALTVTGLGTTLSDAVQRVIKVVPDGKAQVETHSGGLDPGQVSYAAIFPPEAVPGSQLLFVNVYPAYLTQVVEGMDSMLSQPFG